MAGRFRIRVRARLRDPFDRDLLAQAAILLGRELADTRNHEDTSGSDNEPESGPGEVTVPDSNNGDTGRVRPPDSAGIADVTGVAGQRKSSNQDGDHGDG